MSDKDKALKLVKWCGENLWRESSFLWPDPATHVPLIPLLDKIKELYALEADDIDTALCEGQDERDAKRAAKS